MEFFSDFIFQSSQSASFAVRAISPELGKPHEKRSKVLIKSHKNVVLLQVSADDKHALMASFHSYGRLLGLCVKLQEA